MKRKEIFTLLGSICLVLVLSALPFMAACAKPAPPPEVAPPPEEVAPTPEEVMPPAEEVAPPVVEPIVLKATTFLPSNFDRCKDFWDFANLVNEKAKGELIIDIIGGPEVVPLFDQGEAVRRGVIDMCWVFSSAYAGLVPEIATMPLTLVPSEVEEERGYWDVLSESHEKAGLFFLGRGGNKPLSSVMYTILREPIEAPYELEGKRIAIEYTGVSWLRDYLSAIPINVSDAERYTALERGLVDGHQNPIFEVYPFGLHEVAKYVIDHSFLSHNLVIPINLDTWNRLPKHLQDILKEARLESTVLWRAFWDEVNGKHRQLLLDAGVEFITFSPEDAKWYVDGYYETEWKDYIEKYPDIGPGLKEMLTP